jgi:cation diffusion facilitator CzcD-associated flavoprotein CzcO
LAEPRFKVAIVGAGFSGIGMAATLRREGIDNVVVFERAPDYGGVWQHNSYPGAACDVPSYLYSYSFAQRGGWSRPCSPQREILGYLHEVASKHGVAETVRCSTEIVSAAYDDLALCWTLESAAGDRFECELLILACGQLSRPAIPDISGLERFAGPAFHSATWDHDVDLAGKRVAVIGTGASAIQLVPPVAEQVAHLDVYQRSAPWLLPRRNPSYPRWFRYLNDRFPGLQRARRNGMWMLSELMTLGFVRFPPVKWLLQVWSTAFMGHQVPDRGLRRRIWPDYPIGCKRVLFSSYYLPALQRPNVELVTSAIERVTEDAVVTEDGVSRPVDAIVFGTGFKANDFVSPLQVHGRKGLALNTAWAAGAHAHHGITVSGFPNMFLLYGPNTNLGSGSVIMMLEAQIGYVIQAIGALEASGADALEVTPEIQAQSTDRVQERLRDTVWTSCKSWYRVEETGRITNNWPGQIYQYQRLLRRFDRHSYWYRNRSDDVPAARRQGVAEVA